ncbi:hypothetical protein COM64_16775 [Bacillus toyonensis]|uniref:Uncharacterized protein n=1 Tax=Bacillus toyonensis TaxID=155322 RepID=A0AB36T5A8_9BACI|nr:hypothetical protein CON55_30095 [Bacillus toyonensis]PEN88770.1 hypothetical protein CN551_12250 [Bacillus toyonensis]PGE06841.1 hypothetical protein COM54_26840 [Bacillus toyonensis]PGE17862.1 hypothetical protein COM64_16775 [Bacillus toyonensis]
MIHTIGTLKSKVIKSNLLFLATIKMLSRMISSPVYPVDFAIEKSLLINVELKTLFVCIFSTLELRIVNVMLTRIGDSCYEAIIN